MTLENFKKFLINMLLKELDFLVFLIDKDGNNIAILLEDLIYKKRISIKDGLENNSHLHLDVVLEKYANPIVLMRSVYVTKYS